MPESIEDEIENDRIFQSSYSCFSPGDISPTPLPHQYTQAQCGDLEYDSADDETLNYEELLPLNVRYL